MNEQTEPELNLADDAPILFGSDEYRRLAAIPGGLDDRIVLRPDEPGPKEPKL